MMLTFIGGIKNGEVYYTENKNLVGYIRDSQRGGRIYYHREGDNLIHRWSGPHTEPKFRNWYKETYGVQL